MSKDIIYRDYTRINIEIDDVVTFIETLQENWEKLQSIDEELNEDVCLFVTTRKDFYLSSKSNEYKTLYEMVESYLIRHNKFADERDLKKHFNQLYRYLFSKLSKANIKEKYKPFVVFDKSSNRFCLDEKVFEMIENENIRYIKTKKEKKVIETINNIITETRTLKDLLDIDSEFGTLKTLLGIINRKGYITERINEII